MATRKSKFPTLTERTITGKIARAKRQKGPVYGTYVLTPQAAQRILTVHNKRNRTLSTASVEAIAGDMKNGFWIENSGQPIKFSDDGSLLDGQHRLAAISKLGQPIAMEIVFGVPERARIVTDTGRPRTFGDNIAMDGTKYACALSATTRLLKQFIENPYFEGVKFKNSKVSSSNLEVVLRDHPGLYKSIEETKNSHLLRQGIHSYVAFLHYVFSNTSHKARVAEFFEKLATGENMSSDNPIMAYRSRVQREGQAFRSQTNRENVLGMLIQTWNAFIRGDKVQRCHTPKTFPKVEGLKAINGVPIYTKGQQTFTLTQQNGQAHSKAA